jgi:hypothetical protein
MSGMSQASVSRVERADAPNAALAMYAILFATLGCALTVRPYPVGSPVRDAAHARLIARLVAILPRSIRSRTEVPLGRSAVVRAGDLRAWDGDLRLARDRCTVEAETVLSDIQAFDRRVALKMADGHVDRVILLVADTRRNREALRDHRALLAARFPLLPGQVLGALRSGRLPDRSGIAVM